MWRLYGELFVLVTLAFAFGALLAALIIRIAVEKPPAEHDDLKQPSSPAVGRLRP